MGLDLKEQFSLDLLGRVDPPKDIRKWAEDRIHQMSLTPCMWAQTREGFAAQLYLLLEILGANKPWQEILPLFPMNGNIVLTLADPLDDVFAGKLINAAQA